MTGEEEVRWKYYNYPSEACRMDRAEFCVFSFNMPLFYQLNQRILQNRTSPFSW